MINAKSFSVSEDTQGSNITNEQHKYNSAIPKSYLKNFSYTSPRESNREKVLRWSKRCKVHPFFFIIIIVKKKIDSQIEHLQIFIYEPEDISNEHYSYGTKIALI